MLLPVCSLQVFFNGANVRQVDVPTQTGAFGILAAHVPTLQVLRPGLVVVHAEDGTTSKYFGESRGWGWAGPRMQQAQAVSVHSVGESGAQACASRSWWWVRVRVRVRARLRRRKSSRVSEELMGGVGTTHTGS